MAQQKTRSGQNCELLKKIRKANKVAPPSMSRCPICLLKYRDMPEETLVCILACGHYMCMDCAQSWLRVQKGRSRTAPLFKCIMQCDKTTHMGKKHVAQGLLYLPEEGIDEIMYADYVEYAEYAEYAQNVLNAFYVQDIVIGKIKRVIEVVLKAQQAAPPQQPQ